jgi:hypothetical protein
MWTSTIEHVNPCRNSSSPPLPAGGVRAWAALNKCNGFIVFLLSKMNIYFDDYPLWSGRICQVCMFIYMEDAELIKKVCGATTIKFCTESIRTTSYEQRICLLTAHICTWPRWESQELEKFQSNEWWIWTSTTEHVNPCRRSSSPPLPAGSMRVCAALNKCSSFIVFSWEMKIYFDDYPLWSGRIVEFRNALRTNSLVGLILLCLKIARPDM